MRDVSAAPLARSTTALPIFIHFSPFCVAVYGKNLESELISETSGNFKRLLVSLCTGGRDESGIVDLEAANRDATELLRAGELRAGTDESTFNMVFCKRNYAQIKIICDEYQRMTGHSLEKAIRNEFSGDIMVCKTRSLIFTQTRIQFILIPLLDFILFRMVSSLSFNAPATKLNSLHRVCIRAWRASEPMTAN